MTATCFIILALSGLNITFGKPLLLPLLGPEAFTTWSELAKYAHNYLSFPFTIGVVLIFLMWVGGNIPNSVDVEWVKRGGGIVGNDHPPAYRFNAGQKMIYWIVVIGGGASAVTGLSVAVPVLRNRHRRHADRSGRARVVGVLFIAAMLGHIYIGTIGMEGAFEAMGEGTVDVNWAKQHHKLWLEDEIGEQPQRRANPASRIIRQKSLAMTPGCKAGRFAIRGHAHHRSRRLERLRQNNLDHQADPTPDRARAQAFPRSSTPIMASIWTSRARILSFIAPPAPRR